THDQAEAYAMADRIAVIIDGSVEQTDRPEHLYRRPGSPAVARFLGLHNLIEGKIAAGGMVMTEFGVLPCIDASHHRSSHVTLLIQPDAARIGSADSAGGQPCFRIAGRVSNLLYRGTHHTMEMETSAGTRLRFDLPDEPQGLFPGQSVALIVDPGGVSVIGGPE
ncbi:MAG TPA: TOBE domain-containing protein, partial [Methanoculleus sp.]|nr:TOBE domain-containing protein [Methanoculleus sp.]